MKKTVILIVSILVLFVFTTSTPAKTKMIDVVHLTDGDVVVGEITRKIPNENIKIKTTDGGKLVTYPLDQIEKISKVEVEYKSRTTATVYAALVPIFPAGLLSFGLPVFSGWGQFYNGQPLKAVGFLANGFISMSMFMASETDTAGMTFFGMVLGGYILSIVDANLTAKKINQLSNQKIERVKLKKDLPTSLNLNYIPDEGWMASYNVRF